MTDEPNNSPPEVEVIIDPTPAPSPAKPVRRRRVGELEKLFYEWLDAKSVGLTKSSQLVYIRWAKPFLKWARRKQLSVKRLDFKDVVKFIQEQQKLGRSNDVIDCNLKIHRWAWHYWIDHGRLTSTKNPFACSHLPKLEKKYAEKLPFTEEQYRRVIAEASRGRSYREWVGLSCTIAWFTGLRMVDVAHLQWEGTFSTVMWDDEVLVVYPQKRKRSGQRLMIPITNELYETLLKIRNQQKQDGLQNPGNWVLPDMHGRYESLGYGRCDLLYRALFDKVGLYDHTFHCFRHGFVTKLINIGIDPMIIGTMTGQDIETIKIYAHPSIAVKREALERSSIEKARESLHQERVHRAMGKVTLL